MAKSSLPDQDKRAFARREDDRLVRGAGRYTSDILPDGCLHLAFLRSPEAHGTIVSLDAEAARAMPGVVAVFTGADVAGLDGLRPNPMLPDVADVPYPILAEDRVLGVGQPVAAVVADTLSAAADAAEAIELEIEPLPPVPDAAPEPLAELREGMAGNRVFRHRWKAGNPEKAFRDAAFIVEATVDHARLAAMTMEPRAVCAVPQDGGGMTVWLGTQAPHRARADLARNVGIAIEEMNVIAPDVGGAFGMKGSLYPEEIFAVWAAHRLARPVRWVALRNEEFLASTHGRGGRLMGRLALDADGRFVAVDADIVYPLGPWLPFSALAPARNAGRVLPGPYDIVNTDIRIEGQLTTTAPMGIYRGAGRPEAAVLMERLTEQAARATGLDPLEIRRRNAIPRAAFPYRTATGETYDSGDFERLLDRAAKAAGYDDLRREVAARREKGEIVGLGASLYIEPCGAGWESARITLGRDGTFLVASGSSDQGQGRSTTYARIAADALGVDQGRVIVRHGNTQTCPAGIGALASRSTAIGGSAVLLVAAELRRRIETVASRLLQADPSALAFLAGGVEGPAGASVAWADLVDAAEKDPDTAPEVEDRFASPGETWASGCVIALLSIEAETGVPTVERIVWADDAGHIVNPLLADGQMTGGLAQGLGEALMERIAYDDDGQLLTGSLMDYAVPRAADMPAVEIVKNRTDATINPLGAKGVGEAGAIGVPGAILNAAIDALTPLGVRDIQMPLTAHTLWRAIREADTQQRETTG